MIVFAQSTHFKNVACGWPLLKLNLMNCPKDLKKPKGIPRNPKEQFPEDLAKRLIRIPKVFSRAALATPAAKNFCLEFPQEV